MAYMEVEHVLDAFEIVYVAAPFDVNLACKPERPPKLSEY